MNVETIIAELTQEIAVRQDFLNAIHRFKSGGPRPEMPAEKPRRQAKEMKPKVGKRKYTRRNAVALPAETAEGKRVTGAAELLDKPQTVGGAMKLLIRNQTRFTGEALRNLMQTDADYQKLLESAGPGAFGANLRYWAKQGYLSMDGETPLEATFTVKDKEWFS